jgi:hypothetical protein
VHWLQGDWRFDMLYLQTGMAPAFVFHKYFFDTCSLWGNLFEDGEQDSAIG